MRCSECTHPVLPIVALDIDGTLGDYHRHFLNFAALYFGRQPMAVARDELGVDLGGYDGSMRFRDYFVEAFGCDLRTFRDVKLAYRQGGMKRSMPAYADAAVLAYSLSERAEIWVTTTRPYMRHDSIDPDTREWLRRNQIMYKYMLYDDDKYGRLAELVDPQRVVAVLDDEPEQYDRAAEVFGGNVPQLRCNLYNGAVKRTFMLGSLDTAKDVFHNNITLWEQAHDATAH